MFVFLHIPKTAGSTLKHIIENQHTRRWSRRMYYDDISNEGRWHPQQAARTVLALSPQQQAASQILYGHFHFGVQHYLPQQIVYYTILRDPAERLISHYYYMLRNHNYLLCHHPEQQRFRRGEISLEEYVSSGKFPDMDNGQTRLLAGENGLSDRIPFGQCTESLLEEAKRNLREHIEVVGLTERFDESLLLIQRLCGWSTPYYVSQNVTKSRPGLAEIPPAALAAIHDRTVLDQQLYKYGVQLFEQRVAEQGTDFAGQVRRFQHLNQRYGQLNLRCSHFMKQLRRGTRIAVDRLSVRHSYQPTVAPLDSEM